MSITQDSDYEYVEIKVSRKIDIKLSLDDLLTAVAQQANSVADAAHQAPPQVLDRLKQLGQLAHDLKGQVPQLPGGSA